MKKARIDPAIAMIRAERGLAVRIADALGIDKSAVYQWVRVPATRVQIVSELIGMPPEKIRPDIFKRF
jgi:DNA-binding transcriptional regulator YdaS (Cro superfamily)